MPVPSHAFRLNHWATEMSPIDCSIARLPPQPPHAPDGQLLSRDVLPVAALLPQLRHEQLGQSRVGVAARWTVRRERGTDQL
mmetsp:Transcript_29124/g.89214  ORF Transcript_29124/g.89214 Transcript_29124/m.89214 type:complete len:82 (-) Transcript_29124:306-551(-)